MKTPNLDKAREKVAKDVVLRFRRDASALKLKATGSLDSSWGYDLVRDKIEFFANEYANALNDGTTPAKMSSISATGKFDRMKAWAKAKGLRPLTKDSKGRSTFAKYKDNEKVYNSMVWAILKSVSKRGIVKRFNYGGSGFIDKIIKEQKEGIIIHFEKAFKQDVLNNLK